MEIQCGYLLDSKYLDKNYNIHSITWNFQTSEYWVMCQQRLYVFPWLYNYINNANLGPVNLSIPIDFFKGKNIPISSSIFFFCDLARNSAVQVPK